MPKISKKEFIDKFLKKWIEGYKTKPDEYKERLVIYVYNAWFQMLSIIGEHQYSLSGLCDFDVNEAVESLVYDTESKKELHRYCFSEKLLKEARIYSFKKDFHLSLLLYATYFEHWFNDLINCLAITKNLDEKLAEKIMHSFNNDLKVNLLVKLFDLADFDETIKKDISKIFELRNGFVHYKWKAKKEERRELYIRL